MRHSQANIGIRPEFEEHVRSVMATGSTSRQTREGLILNAAQFLRGDELELYRLEIPRVEWFSKQREALGLESYLYTFMRIAGCDSIRQWGFDETKIDGHDTFNQWAMLVDGEAIGTFTTPINKLCSHPSTMTLFCFSRPVKCRGDHRDT